MHRHVTGRAVLIPRAPEIVERRRLRPEGLAVKDAVTLETELSDPRPLERHRVGRTVRFVTAHAGTGDVAHVRIDEGPSLLGMARNADRLARTIDLEARLAAAAVRVVARNALEPAAIEIMTEGLFEGARLG